MLGTKCMQDNKFSTGQRRLLKWYMLTKADLPMDTAW